ncbi:pentatricopeptide repeat protein [Trichophyton tonsurans CBS 112818]|uniref:Pentatricopeptide repeat protein n=1 Tax=Trichophyton tonsurans (strain CBS 112818) TaxID=647933 RepID=F2S3C9_TRIT1|nr:pentatricopeptide repeat protein [Trichophyton tonsurans CBS 112818]
MVFKPFTHLARQTFSKTFVHGYAQSVVAASQSSYAPSASSLNQITSIPQTVKYTRTAQLQSAFQHASGSSSSASGAKAGHSATSGSTGDSGLAAYYAAWQHAQQTGDDSDWKQFQFTKRIGWKPAKEEKDSLEESDVDQLAASVSRVRSRSEVRASRNVESAPVDKDVSAKVDEAVAREIQEIQEAHALAESEYGTSAAESGSEVFDVQSGEQSHQTPASSVQESIVSPRTPVNDISLYEKKQAESRSNAIVELAKDGAHAKVPAAFESLLRDGVKPTASAYNALLEAAIRLHPETHNAVPKALDVYSDMLRRSVMPNEDTYKIIVQLLSTRSLDCLRMAKDLEKSRVRFGGMEEPGKFIFQSSEVEHELLTEDHSLPIALKLFNVATTRHPEIAFPLTVYRSLLTACAMQGNVDQMIEIFAHMEANKVAPHAAMFPPMVDTFSMKGDFKSAVECYNEYKTLAIADNNGVFGIVERQDAEVYASVIKAYLSCGNTEGAHRFFNKIRASFDGVENQAERLRTVEQVILKDGFVQHSLDARNFASALHIAQSQLHGQALTDAALNICIAAADANDIFTATGAYRLLTTDAAASVEPAIAMLALHIRQGSLEMAKPFWDVLSSSSRANASFIQPVAMYTIALLKSGQIEEGLMEARSMFARIRSASSSAAANEQKQRVREEIDEAIDLLGRILIQAAAPLSPHSAMTLMWCMVENGGLVSPVAEYVVASLGPMGISHLTARDLTLAMQAQAGMLVNGSTLFDAAHPLRFAHMLDVAMNAGIRLDDYTKQLLERGIAKLGDVRPDVAQKWHHYIHGSTPVFTTPSYNTPSPAAPQPQPSPGLKPARPDDSFDPYAHSTDFRGSSIIAEMLESTRGRIEDHLNNAMTKFKNMRRIGRHPRYITYAKLITAAAKCGHMNMVHEILGMAKHDVPLLPQYNAVKYGWTSILDAMVAACLTTGERSLAAKYHQELLNMGSTPSANTFGLYITTLKESTKTFDEASEAVKVFHRATSEGVEPTSFLYNALIGKLGKARRIDDCLLYFAEMRANNVRPTSVTYGTIVNALCRVSDERFAEEMFDEMESMPNYKPRPAPYNSIIQYFLNTKRDRSKVLAYYERMKSKDIQPTMHTYKLLIDAYASLEPVNMTAATEVLDTIRASGQLPEAVHYASLIHARGCVLHDMAGARGTFDSALAEPHLRPQACLYQALFESMVANHQVSDTPAVLADMAANKVSMTAYIANTLIHGWATTGNVGNAKAVYDGVGIDKREPSTYEAMTRAFLAAEDHAGADGVVREMLSRGYPSAVTGKVLDLVSGGQPA